MIGVEPNQGLKPWSIMRTHDGFTIQYGEEKVEIDLHYGLDRWSNMLHLLDTAPNIPNRRWKFEKIRSSDEVGGEVVENLEDQVAALSEQLRKAGAEIAAKDRLLVQKERELQEALKARRELPVKVIESQLAELRQKIEGLEYLVKSYSDYSERPDSTS
ncbi:unnamed protein product [Rhizoctonia solani]|uniref:Uncharacterized protein n=1 Tax=Rhizoctonia solani TaxID=456999 RepID=A0A8H3DVU3_9AGAM|nr:unnamed protein product [Rhizoctonia solani]